MWAVFATVIDCINRPRGQTPSLLWGGGLVPHTPQQLIGAMQQLAGNVQPLQLMMVWLCSWLLRLDVLQLAAAAAAVAAQLMTLAEPRRVLLDVVRVPPAYGSSTITQSNTTI